MFFVLLFTNDNVILKVNVAIFRESYLAVVVDKVKAACCTLRNVACLRCNGRTCDKNEFDACSVDEDLRIIFRNLILSDRNVIDLNTPLQASCSMQKCCELDLCFRRTGCESTV